MSTGAPALQLAPLPPNSVRVRGYEDYRVMFLPLAREDIERRLAAGETLSPNPEHWIRLQAGCYATDALLRPGRAAAAAIGFFARRMGELEREAK